MMTSQPNQQLGHRLDFLPPETVSYLKAFAQRFPRDRIINYIEKLKGLKVLVVGEAIIDEYHFGQSIGKVAKEPIIALRSLKKEMYAGGSLAIANHLADFCKEVGLLAMVGGKDSRLAFIKKSLKNNIKLFPLRKNGSPTIVKTRFLEVSPFQKLLELYTMDDSDLDRQQSRVLRDILRPLLSEYDVVICADFGHGMLDEKTRNLLMQKSRFLALTVQVNASNFGYHTISKYPRADFVCVDERELRLEAQKRSGGLEEIMKEIAKRFDYRFMMLTKGEEGCFACQKKNRIIHTPSLGYRHVDRVGAGDAFLSIVAPLLSINVPLEVAGFAGNTAGAIAIDTIGNKKSITKKVLLEYIDSLLSS